MTDYFREFECLILVKVWQVAQHFKWVLFVFSTETECHWALFISRTWRILLCHGHHHILSCNVIQWCQRRHGDGSFQSTLTPACIQHLCPQELWSFSSSSWGAERTAAGQNCIHQADWQHTFTGPKYLSCQLHRFLFIDSLNLFPSPPSQVRRTCRS